MTNTYESIFICPGDISQEKVESTLEKVKGVISKADGKVTSAELWGRRKLSYPIERHRDGFYVYLVFNSPPQVMGNLNHYYRVTDTVIRGLTVKVDPKNVDKIKPSVRLAPTDAVQTPGAQAPGEAATAAVSAPAATSETPAAKPEGN